MPTERTLPEPLNGEEVITAIVEKIRNSLRLDCFLSPNRAYDYFSARVTIDLRCTDIGRVDPIHQEISTGAGAPPATDENLTTFSGEMNIDPQPPNEVRIETEQPVPVLTKEDDKPVIKRVKYSPKKHGKAAS